MEKIIDAVLLRLSKTEKFDTEKLMLVRYALADVLSGYSVTGRENEVVPGDLFNPPGYQEFFVDKIMQGMSKKTLDMYKYCIDRFLAKMHKPIDKITGEDIALYLYSKRVTDHASERYANNLRKYLSTFFRWLFEHEYIPKNPMIHVNPIKVPSRVKKPLTIEQFEMLMKNATAQRDRAMLAVMAGSGLRREEVRGMKRSDLDLENNRFTIIGKGNKERVCFLTSRAKMELRLYLQERNDDSDYVFVRARFPHDQLSVKGINFIIGQIGQRAGLKVHPHMLRHYFAGCAHDANIDVVDIARMMGHASISTTQIYIASNTEDLAYKHSRMR